MSEARTDVSEHGDRPGGPASPTGPLWFPDTARRELEQAIDLLIERANAVRRAQDRMGSLLRASHLVASHVELPQVLHRIVVAARELVDSEYAALGVLGPDGTVAEFVYEGIDAAGAARIGHPPRGRVGGRFSPGAFRCPTTVDQP